MTDETFQPKDAPPRGPISNCSYQASDNYTVCIHHGGRKAYDNGTCNKWPTEQAEGRVFEIDDALADVAIEGIYGTGQVRSMKSDHDYYYTEYADMRRDQKQAIRAVFDKLGLPYSVKPRNEGVANAE